MSVLVPAMDEEGNLSLFIELCDSMIRAQPEQYEVIVIDDGSKDASWALLQQLALRRLQLRTRAVRGAAPRPPA